MWRIPDLQETGRPRRPARTCSQGCSEDAPLNERFRQGLELSCFLLCRVGSNRYLVFNDAVLCQASGVRAQPAISGQHFRICILARSKSSDCQQVGTCTLQMFTTGRLKRCIWCQSAAWNLPEQESVHTCNLWAVLAANVHPLLPQIIPNLFFL